MESNILKKEIIKHDWYFIVYRDLNEKYTLSAAFNQRSYINHLNMIKNFGKVIAVKEGATKEDRVPVDELIKGVHEKKIKNLETELLRLNFTLPR